MNVFDVMVFLNQDMATTTYKHNNSKAKAWLKFVVRYVKFRILANFEYCMK